MQKSLLPLPVPFSDVRWHTHSKVSRSVLRRAHSKIGWQSWANGGVCTINELNGIPGNPGARPTCAQSTALSQFCSDFAWDYIREQQQQLTTAEHSSRAICAGLRNTDCQTFEN